MSAVSMFLVSDTFPFRFMLGTCVHFDFWNEKTSKFFKGFPSKIWGIFLFFIQKLKIWKMPQIIEGPFEKFKKNYSKNQNVHTYVFSIHLKGKVSYIKNLVTALVYFWKYPYGTPCSMHNTDLQYITYLLLVFNNSVLYRGAPPAGLWLLEEGRLTFSFYKMKMK